MRILMLDPLPSGARSGGIGYDGLLRTHFPRRPVWAEIDLARLRQNYHRLVAHVPAGTSLLAVVKANAYGHDAELCAPELVRAGAAWLGVTSAEEGAQVRAALASHSAGTPRILVMAGLWPGQAELAVEQQLSPVVWLPRQLQELAAAARQAGKTVGVHLELDTGMSRQGVEADNRSWSELEQMLALWQETADVLRLEGVMTHLASADDLDSGQNDVQLSRLQQGLERVLAAGLRPQWVHAGSSATVLSGGVHGEQQRLVQMAEDAGARLMLRPGLALYGYAPRLNSHVPVYDTGAGLKTVLSWKTRITSLRTIPPGEAVGYNQTFVAARESRIALLAVGYADGFHRALSNRFRLLVRGLPAPIAGRISMDQTMLDVTDVPGVEEGDEVVLLGDQGPHSITAFDHADALGTIPWEVLCAISHRVERIAQE